MKVFVGPSAEFDFVKLHRDAGHASSALPESSQMGSSRAGFTCRLYVQKLRAELHASRRSFEEHRSLCIVEGTVRLVAPTASPAPGALRPRTSWEQRLGRSRAARGLRQLLRTRRPVEAHPRALSTRAAQGSVFAAAARRSNRPRRHRAPCACASLRARARQLNLAGHGLRRSRRRGGCPAESMSTHLLVRRHQRLEMVHHLGAIGAPELQRAVSRADRFFSGHHARRAAEGRRKNARSSTRPAPAHSHRQRRDGEGTGVFQRAPCH
jgi:hypothetical protein